MSSNPRHAAYNAMMAARDAQPKTEADNSVTLATFDRGGREHVRVSLKTFEGRQFVDVRRWFIGGDGQWRPMVKGASVRLSELDALIAALVKAQELAQ